MHFKFPLRKSHKGFHICVIQMRNEKKARKLKDPNWFQECLPSFHNVSSAVCGGGRLGKSKDSFLGSQIRKWDLIWLNSSYISLHVFYLLPDRSGLLDEQDVVSAHIPEATLLCSSWNSANLTVVGIHTLTRSEVKTKLLVCVCVVYIGLSSWLSSKEFACEAEDTGDAMGLRPGSGRSLGEGHGNPLQYSCLGDSHGQRSLAGCGP